ncbi:hypothetical protein HK405_000988, partial [Cladochytrium tenue]
LSEATYHRESGELFRMLAGRLHEQNWTVVLKSLILIHILIREGNTDRVLGYLAANPEIIDVRNFRDKSLTPLSVSQAKNIRMYSSYLQEKVASYNSLKDDLVKAKAEHIARFRSMPENKLLEVVPILQKQITALLDCS